MREFDTLFENSRELYDQRREFETSIEESGEWLDQSREELADKQSR